jgi:hypothetical protein
VTELTATIKQHFDLPESVCSSYTSSLVKLLREVEVRSSRNGVSRRCSDGFVTYGHGPLQSLKKHIEKESPMSMAGDSAGYMRVRVLVSG